MVKGPLFASFQWWGNYAAQVIGDVAKVLASLILAVTRLLSGDFSGAIEAVTAMLDHLLGLISDVLGLVGRVAGDAWSTVKGWFGGGEQAAPRPALTPSPALGGAVSNSATLSASTLIQVDGSRDPEATARAVGAEQRRVNSDLVRNVKGAAS